VPFPSKLDSLFQGNEEMIPSLLLAQVFNLCLSLPNRIP